MFTAHQNPPAILLLSAFTRFAGATRDAGASTVKFGGNVA
jgi:hypothetical protein